MTRFRIGLFVVLWLGGCALDAQWTLGQDQPGGNPPSQRPGGREGGGRASNRPPVSPEDMLKSLDTNGNGMLEEDEVKSSPARQMIEGLLTRLGIEQKYPIAISEIVKAMENSRRAQGREQSVPTAAAAMIRLEVVLGELPAAKTGGDAPTPSAEELRKQMEVLFRAELATLDNQPAFVQVGRREPRITGVIINNTGRTNSITLDNVGTIMKFTPHVLADHSVNVQLDVVDSRYGPTDEGVIVAIPTNGEAVRSPIVENSETNSTVHIANGETVVLSGVVRTPKTEKPRVVLVTAHVLPVGEAKPGK
jgi:hypothetical protein